MARPLDGPRGLRRFRRKVICILPDGCKNCALEPLVRVQKGYIRDISFGMYQAGKRGIRACVRAYVGLLSVLWLR
jgi:hypothetical protein